jgi:hypothetical protein
MTDTSSSETQPEADTTASVSNVSGGVNIAGDAQIGNDVVGRDKIVQATTYIEHATIIQSAPASENPAMDIAAPRVGAPQWGGVEFVRIPSGEFLMGSRADNPLASDSEKPQHPIELVYDYWIGRYPVTNEQFARFVTTIHYPFDLGEWQSRSDLPVVKVSWLDALAYCKWFNTLITCSEGIPMPSGYPMPARTVLGDARSTDFQVRLPTEAEWERAARGNLSPATDEGEWPWGNEFDHTKCNSEEGAKKAPRRSAHIRRRAIVPMASRTWLATCGSGPSACGGWITFIRSIAIHISRTTGAKNSMRLHPCIAWCAAAPSTLDRAACVPQRATGSIRARHEAGGFRVVVAPRLA